MDPGYLSTHGAGELPENLQPLLEALTAQAPSLAEVTYDVIGIGSSEYDTFCGAIDTFASLRRSAPSGSARC